MERGLGVARVVPLVVRDGTVREVSETEFEDDLAFPFVGRGPGFSIALGIDDGFDETQDVFTAERDAVVLLSVEGEPWRSLDRPTAQRENEFPTGLFPYDEGALAAIHWVDDGERGVDLWNIDERGTVTDLGELPVSWLHGMFVHDGGMFLVEQPPTDSLSSDELDETSPRIWVAEFAGGDASEESSALGAADSEAGPVAALDEIRSLNRSAEQVVLVTSAEELLVSRCMAERGFPYIPEPPSVSDIEPSLQGFMLETIIPEIFENDDGTVSYRLASTYDAMIEARRNPGSSRPSANVQYVGSLDEVAQQEYSAALNGGADLGCSEVARQDLGTDMENQRLGLVNRLREFVLFGEALTPVLDEWTACMDGLGEPDQFGPTAIAFSLVEEYAQGSNNALLREQMLAELDLQCRQQTDFDRRAGELLEDAAAQLIAENEAAIGRIEMLETAILREATTVLERG